MEKWIEEYIKLLFPINSNEIDIDAAKKIKVQHTPRRLFKYRGVSSEYSFTNFENDELSLSEASKLNDPFECSNKVVDSSLFIKELRRMYISTLENSAFFNDLEKEKLNNCSDDDFFSIIESKSEVASKMPKGTLKRFTEEMIASLCDENNKAVSDNNSNNIYICALSETNESSAMWAHYAEEFKGFCIEYNFESIVWQPLWCSLQPVIYQDDIPDFSLYFQNTSTFNNLISIYASMIKGTDWQYEREWRLTIPLGKQSEPYFIVKTPKPVAIYLGLRISIENQERLIKIAKSKGIPVYKMGLPKTSFKVEYKQIA